MKQNLEKEGRRISGVNIRLNTRKHKKIIHLRIYLKNNTFINKSLRQPIYTLDYNPSLLTKV